MLETCASSQQPVPSQASAEAHTVHSENPKRDHRAKATTIEQAAFCAQMNTGPHSSTVLNDAVTWLMTTRPGLTCMGTCGIPSTTLVQHFATQGMSVEEKAQTKPQRQCFPSWSLVYMSALFLACVASSQIRTLSSGTTGVGGLEELQQAGGVSQSACMLGGTSNVLPTRCKIAFAVPCELLSAGDKPMVSDSKEMQRKVEPTT